MTHDEAEAILGEAAAKVGEHFDAVLIIGTWSEDKETHRSFNTSGNWYTCIGMAHDFLESSDHEDLASKLADAIADKEGWDGDDA